MFRVGKESSKSFRVLQEVFSGKKIKVYGSIINVQLEHHIYGAILYADEVGSQLPALTTSLIFILPTRLRSQFTSAATWPPCLHDQTESELGNTGRSSHRSWLEKYRPIRRNNSCPLLSAIFFHHFPDKLSRQLCSMLSQ